MILPNAISQAWTRTQTRRIAELEVGTAREDMTDLQLREEFWAATKLLPRWAPLIDHPEQMRLVHDPFRFKLVPAGRRSGKTERAKRRLVEEAVLRRDLKNGWFIAAAPTRDQAKRIYWQDLKMMIPSQFLLKRPSESDLNLHLWNGNMISLIGMDQPARVEGPVLDGIVLDEYGNMKPEVWSQNVRPALSTRGREGWAWLIGVPEGRNHYFQLYLRALESEDWGVYTWPSEDILDPKEIATAKAELDPLTYQQEYCASFVNFEGRVYYRFNSSIHTPERVMYSPEHPLILCFDFNSSPGVAVVCQERAYEGNRERIDLRPTHVIDEVWIQQDSNTLRVISELLKRYGEHRGNVFVYGDATGGAKGTSAVAGSDWDLIRGEFKRVFGRRLKMRVRPSNPRERVRVNAVNSRLRSTDDVVHMVVDPVKCPKLIMDFEGVTTREGTDGEIDKDADSTLTHLSDALGYYIAQRWPVTRDITQVDSM